jgi:hypothetical protein
MPRHAPSLEQKTSPGQMARTPRHPRRDGPVRRRPCGGQAQSLVRAASTNRPARQPRRLIAGRATGSPDPGRGPHRLFSAPGGAPRTGPPTAPLRPLAGRVTGTMIARPALGRHDAARASSHAAVSGRAGLLSLRVLRPGSSRGGTPTCATSRPAWATITAADSWPRGMTVDAADGPTSRLDQPFVGDRAPGRASRIQRR